MPPEKLISLESTARECTVVGSVLRRGAGEFVLLPRTLEAARKLSLRFAFFADAPEPVQSTEADR
jgi:hypothetical protein